MNDSISRAGAGRHPVGLVVVVGLHVALATVLLLNQKLRVPPHRDPGTVDVVPDHPVRPPDPVPQLPVPKVVPPQMREFPVPPIDPSEAQTQKDQPTFHHPEGEGREVGPGIPGPAVVLPVVPPVPRPPGHARSARIDASALSCLPEYPAIALREGATGVSRIRFTVDALGHVVRAETLQSAGPTRAHRLLDRAAADALQSCPITVGTDENGRPVGTTVDVEYAWVKQ